MKRLATIGYEGASIPDFIATLKLVGIETVVDVRELPLSRRKGFSKNALSGFLQAAGIGYLHLRDLGDPKDGREAAREGRVADFRRIYSKHLRTVRAQLALTELRAIVASTDACLLCYEREPNQCHRTMVAAALADEGRIWVAHLGVRSGVGEDAGTAIRYRARSSVSEGIAAAE